MERWNYKTRSYDPYTPPKGKVMMYSDDMDEKCVCAACGKGMRFGEGYTSLEIHNQIGFGYIVCEECHHLEVDRRLADIDSRYDREVDE